MEKEDGLVSIVIPTYNEVKNIEILLSQIDGSMKDIAYEVIIVDDNSPDGTGEKADEMAATYPVRAVHRKGKLGLASAVMEGFDAARGDILGCMDADLSHPPAVLPELVSAIRDGGADMVIASRLIEGGDVAGDWPLHRRLNSYVAGLLARPLTPVKDAMSGCFFLKKEVIEGAQLVPRGYKIALEILVKGKYKEVKEVPIIFDDRRRGVSKLSFRTQMEYLAQLCHLYLYWFRNGRSSG